MTCLDPADARIIISVGDEYYWTATVHDILEQAKKLLKSGAIKLDASNREKRFKRARLEKSAISKVGLSDTGAGLRS